MAVTRLGLIGAGFMGALHARSLASLPEAELVAVADLIAPRARELAGPSGAAYADYHEMLAREDLDAVIVATGDDQHRDPCLAAIQAGAHMLVEKPLATSIADCDAIGAAAQEHGVRVLVGHTLRWEPRYALAQEAIARGDLGAVSYVFARRSNVQAVARRVAPTTNVARFLAIHDIDWVQWALGEQAGSVTARTASRVLTDLGTPDAYFLLLRFPSGALACLEAAWILPDRGSLQMDFQVEAVGSEGALSISVQDQGLRIDRAGGAQWPDILYAPVIRGQVEGVYVNELRHFLDVVRQGTAPACSIAEGRAAVATLLAAEQSAASGAEVPVN
jgi:predicted dehydrogenase